jgi:seryl-tRNA synthetase
MGAVDDYISGLEGKESLDPLEVARKLHELHTQEVSTREAKISQLDTEKETLASQIAAKESEIEKWKAKNFDLAMQIPGAPAEPKPRDENEKPDAGTIKTADLFTPKVRQRNPHFRTGR